MDDRRRSRSDLTDVAALVIVVCVIVVVIAVTLRIVWWSWAG